MPGPVEHHRDEQVVAGPILTLVVALNTIWLMTNYNIPSIPCSIMYNGKTYNTIFLSLMKKQISAVIWPDLFSAVPAFSAPRLRYPQKMSYTTWK